MPIYTAMLIFREREKKRKEKNCGCYRERIGRSNNRSIDRWLFVSVGPLVDSIVRVLERELAIDRTKENKRKERLIFVFLADWSTLQVCVSVLLSIWIVRVSACDSFVILGGKIHVCVLFSWPLILGGKIHVCVLFSWPLITGPLELEWISDSLTNLILTVSYLKFLFSSCLLYF